MHLFYTPHIAGQTFELDEQESKHAIRVLRLVQGDHVILVDGHGGWYEAVIQEDHPKRCLLKIHSRRADYRPLPYYLHLAISPTKSMERFEWFLEKATEIGFSEVTPLICQRTERRHVKMERLDKIIISAMKQSLKAHKPVLSEPVPMEEFLRSKVAGTKGIAHCHPGEDRLSLSELDHTGSYTLMVGPEGDFTQEEVSMARNAGYLPFHLGEYRLRTETAGVHICTAIQILNSTISGEQKKD